ncbi:MAG: hypothetical protein CL847_07440 [Crocinitomicaceae bacterium]|nr:hypothetical protein [Crocinitomicaceae bacterium]|tara:strand:+ start:7872 stop:9143 length:1272 start_codon:yes stop_codon:yes gene_type:complete
MMRMIFSTIAIVSLAFSSINAQVYTTSESSSFRNDSLFKKSDPVSIREYSFEFWGNQTSNTITAGFMNTIGHGGFISKDDLDPIMNAHIGNFGYLGANAGFNVSWSTKPREGKQWSLCGSFGSEVIVDSRWTKDLFQLIWYGNANLVGDVNVISGSGARVGLFNRLSLGGIKNDTKQRIELSFVQRLVGGEWSVPYGYFYVTEDADSLETYLQTEARLHFGSDNTLMPTYGVAISGMVPIRSEDLPVEIDIYFKDVGLLFEPEGSQVYWVQEGISTTGLPVFGDSLTWENIIDGNISTDTLLQSGKSVNRMALLPSKLGATLRFDISEKIGFNAHVSVGGWMPEPLYSCGIDYKYSDNINLGARTKIGGWGDERLELYGRIDIPGDRVLYIAVEEPIGLFFQDSNGAHTTCRGITLRLSKENE